MFHEKAIPPTPAIELVAGGYTLEGSAGIYRLSYQPATGELSAPELLVEAENPSYLAMVAHTLYAVNEVDEGRLSAYHWDDQIERLSSAPTHGAAPCYVSLSPDGRYLATANYSGGSITVFPRLESGGTGDALQVLQHEGSLGADESRQEAPHAHWVQWSSDGRRIYAVDLGIDEVLMYEFDPATGSVANQSTALKLERGDGPRHLFFHPELPVAYVLNELSNTVVVASRAPDGRLTETQRLNTLPAGFTEYSQAAHLQVTRDGRYLYASNRGHDSIATFAIDAHGDLQLVDTASSGGNWPRHFLVLEDAGVVVVANQHSGRLSVLPLMENGAPGTPQASVELPQVTFIGRRPLND